jgi:hypothetical protein
MSSLDEMETYTPSRTFSAIHEGHGSAVTRARLIRVALAYSCGHNHLYTRGAIAGVEQVVGNDAGEQPAARAASGAPTP